MSMGFNSKLVGANLSLFFFFWLAWIAGAARFTKIFNVRNYGALGDGKHDDTKAFEEAWLDACQAIGKPKLLIPRGSYLIGPLMFKGECKAPMRVQLQGRLLASTNLDGYPKNWIEFKYINGLRFYGRGYLDGKGASAWLHNNCNIDPNCRRLPASLVLSFVTNAKINRISSINSKLAHMYIFASKNLRINSVTITAPAQSPNTDGIHISESNNVTVANSIIGTGDDCISILTGTVGVTIVNVTCGPGHGISVGSLGKYKGEKDVRKVRVTNCTFINTENGVRIKTWQSSPITTAATDFVFEQLVMKDVDNPIIIDQKYCPHGTCDAKSPSKVKISNIKFRDIKGTSTTPVAINLLCSAAIPCTDIELSNIDLKYTGKTPATARTSCVNVRGSSIGSVKPPSCIKA